MEKIILFRAVIEIIGRPQEHVEASLREYLEQLKKNKSYQVVQEEVAPAKKQEKEEFWSAFAELEIRVAKVEDLTAFCFDYMPSMVEIVEPEKLNLSDAHLTLLFNDLQTKLHQVDMVAKQTKMENDHLKVNFNSLLKNYVRVLLGAGAKSAEQLSKLTGVPQEQLADFLDSQIDQGKVDLKEGFYSLK